MKNDKGNVRYLAVLIIILCLFFLIPADAVTVTDVKMGLISEDHVKDLAQAALIEFVLSGSPEPNADGWEGASIHPEPLIIYDLNGEPLFYQFDVVEHEVPVGTIKIGASRVLPSSIMTIGFKPRYWDSQQLNKNAMEYFSKECPECTLVSTIPVCYSYPKIGQKVVFQNPNNTVLNEVILDAATGEYVERNTAWSYYNGVSESDLKKNRDQWIREELIHGQILSEARSFAIGAALSDQNEKLQKLGESLVRVPEYRSWIDPRFVPSGSADTAGKQGSKYLPLNLHPQESSYFCTVGIGILQESSWY
ncbi:MAG: hypothetical protein MUC66_06180 [Methanolinea sp.]|nr:hypothetical protein [Methanolinea sp.]